MNHRAQWAAQTVWYDARQGVRRLLRDWRFSLGALAILGVGIGATTATFSAISAALWRPQPIAAPDRLVDIYQRASNPGGIDANSYPAYLDVASFGDLFSGTTAVFIPHGVHYLDDDTLRPAVVEHTTSTYLTVLGLRPALGRWFTVEEEAPGASVVAVVGFDTWRRQFHADPSVVGRTIRMEGVPVTIIGVAPANHRGTIDIGLVTDFWLPIAALPTLGAPSSVLDRRPPEAAFFIKARLRTGVSVEAAQAAMDVLGARLASQYPNEDPGKGIAVFASDTVRVHPQMDGLLDKVAIFLLLVVGLVLAIACSNLATLLLVRGTARAKEVALRLAIGASRGQLVRQLLAESLLLSLAGGLVGCVLAWWTIRWIGTLDLPFAIDVSLDGRVLCFAVLVSVVTGSAFGLMPALRATRVDVMPTLRGDGGAPSERRWLTLKNLLVVGQIVVSVVLLGGTSLSMQAVGASRTRPTGFAVDGVAMVETDARYASTAADADLFNEIRRRASVIPGVQSAALTAGLPMQPTGASIVVEGSVASVGRDAASRDARALWAGPDFFDALRIPILFGRAIDERDRRDTPRVAVISETMARQYFGEGDAASAVGRRFRLARDTGVDSWIEVIGVARDTGTADLGSELVAPAPQLFYRPFIQWDVPATTVIARTSLAATDLTRDLQRELRAVDARLPVISAQTMDDYLQRSLAVQTTASKILAALGVFGLILAGIGLYTIVAVRVSRQSREIGIRMALGATGRRVVVTVGRDVALLVGAGTATGLALTVLATTALRAATVTTPGISLYRPAIDPSALVSIAAFLAMVGTAAAFIPARRAARVDPLQAIRRE